MISSHKLCTYTADHIGRDATCQAEKAIKYRVIKDVKRVFTATSLIVSSAQKQD